MKHLDKFSRRFLVVCVGLSMVASAFALLFFSATPSYADGDDPMAMPFSVPSSQPTAITERSNGDIWMPVGIVGNHFYWIVHDKSSGYLFRRADLDDDYKWKQK